MPDQVAGLLGGLYQPGEAAFFEDEGEERPHRYRALARYMARTLNTHTIWALRLYLSELLLLVNVIGNIYFIDTFLGGEFSTYGLQVDCAGGSLDKKRGEKIPSFVF
jgi:hypothetical protein